MVKLKVTFIYRMVSVFLITISTKHHGSMKAFSRISFGLIRSGETAMEFMIVILLLTMVNGITANAREGECWYIKIPLLTKLSTMETCMTIKVRASVLTFG